MQTQMSLQRARGGQFHVAVSACVLERTCHHFEAKVRGQKRWVRERFPTFCAEDWLITIDHQGVHVLLIWSTVYMLCIYTETVWTKQGTSMLFFNMCGNEMETHTCTHTHTEKNVWPWSWTQHEIKVTENLNGMLLDNSYSSSNSTYKVMS